MLCACANEHFCQHLRLTHSPNSSNVSSTRSQPDTHTQHFSLLFFLLSATPDFISPQREMLLYNFKVFAVCQTLDTPLKCSSAAVCLIPRSNRSLSQNLRSPMQPLRPPDEEALHGKAVWGTIDAADMTRTAFTNFLSYKTGYTACWCPLCFSQECNVLVPLQTYSESAEKEVMHTCL